MWCERLQGKIANFKNIKDYPNEKVLIEKLNSGIMAIGRQPKILVIGALGRLVKVRVS